MDEWVKILVPVILTANLVLLGSLYNRLVSLERDTMHTEVIEFRLHTLEKKVQ